MNRPVKITLYVIFIAAAVCFGLLARSNFRKATAGEKARERKLDEAATVESTNTVAIETTNAAAIEETNAVAAENTNVATAARTNLAPLPKSLTAGAPTVSYSKMISYSLLCAAGFVGFAFLFARDISLFFAHKAEQALFNDDGAPIDPEYEQAEELWKDGKYLEALNAMREYLNKHPREQYVALRIAEIYEENLLNPLAAALEYEEVLKKNLPPERWGWAAIHLANIYSGKLAQPEKAIALLHRIDAEYGQTTAANKARERLTQIDPNFIPAAAAEVAVAGDTTVSQPPSNLPPGFRPKL
jgi:TolA-binding protein